MGRSKSVSVIIPIMLAMLISVCSVLISAQNASAEDTATKEVAHAQYEGSTEANSHQIVLLVRFADDASVNRMNEWDSLTQRNRWLGLIDDLNRDAVAGKTPSLHAYMKTISGGKLEVISQFPQTNLDDSGVRYITLKASRSAYPNATKASSLVKDAVTQFNETYQGFDTSLFDGDKDGYIDNVMLVFDVTTKPKDTDDPIWPRQGSMLDAGIGSLKLGSGTNAKLVNDFTIVPVSTIESSPTTLAHEFIHTLGVKDLYRSGSFAGQTGTGPNPVGYWDIMSHSYPSGYNWPLAQTRADCGWTTLQTKPLDADYTLYSPDSGKDQAFVFHSPMSSSEHFVVEYRKKAALYSNKLDERIGGTGLVVYRVNDNFKSTGNKGEKDYIYVFRPGETGVHNAEGTVDSGFLSLGGTSSWGSTDPDATITDNAYVLSSGINTGITIQVTSQDSDSVTFHIASAGDSGNASWTSAVSSAGSTLMPAANVDGIDTATDGTNEYVMVGTSGKGVKVLCFDGSKWSDLGTVASNLSGMNSKIAWHDGTLYVYGMNNSGTSSSLYKHTSSGWSKVGSPLKAYNNAVLKSVGDELLLLQDSNYTDIELYRLADSEFVRTGGIVASAESTSLALADVSGDVGVVVSSFSGKWTRIYHLGSNGSSWSYTDLDSQYFNTLLSATSGNRCIVVSQSNNSAAKVFEVNSLSEKPVARTLGTDNPALHVNSLIAVNGMAYMAVGSDRLTVLRAPMSNIANWEKVGGTAASEVGAASLSCVGNVLYCAVFENGNGSSDLKSLVIGDDGENSDGNGSGSSGGTSGDNGNGSGSDSGNDNNGNSGSSGSTTTKPGSSSSASSSGSGNTNGSSAGSGNSSSGSTSSSSGTSASGNKPSSNTSSASKTQPISIGNAAIQSVGTKSYKGTAWKPTPWIKVNGKKLVLGKDYKISYRNNKSIGKATITFIGTGSYKGTASTTFRIIPTASSITKVSVAAKGIKLTWKKSATCEGYVIYRSKNGGAYKAVKTLSGHNIKTYTDTGAKGNKTKYRYKIRAFKKVSGQRFYSSYSTVKTTYFVTAPKSVKLTNLKGLKGSVRWEKNLKASGYQIQYSSNNFKSAKQLTVKGRDVSSKVFGKLVKGKSFKARVRAYCKISGKTYYSAWKTSSSVKVVR